MIRVIYEWKINDFSTQQIGRDEHGELWFQSWNPDIGAGPSPGGWQMYHPHHGGIEVEELLRLVEQQRAVQSEAVRALRRIESAAEAIAGDMFEESHLRYRVKGLANMARRVLAGRPEEPAESLPPHHVEVFGMLRTERQTGEDPPDTLRRLLAELAALRELTRPGDPCPACGTQMRYDRDDHQHCYSCGRGYGATPVADSRREAGGVGVGLAQEARTWLDTLSRRAWIPPHAATEAGALADRLAAALRGAPAEARAEATRRYVAGFLFSRDRRYVALIRKSRPEWQRGRLNGIGGKIEDGESPLGAMRREFQEEAGDGAREWEERVVLSGEGFAVHFFVAFADYDHLVQLRGQEDEPIEIVQTDALPSTTISNLRWLVPLCADPDIGSAVVAERAVAAVRSGEQAGAEHAEALSAENERLRSAIRDALGLEGEESQWTDLLIDALRARLQRVEQVRRAIDRAARRPYAPGATESQCRSWAARLADPAPENHVTEDDLKGDFMEHLYTRVPESPVAGGGQAVKAADSALCRCGCARDRHHEYKQGPAGQSATAFGCAACSCRRYQPAPEPAATEAEEEGDEEERDPLPLRQTALSVAAELDHADLDGVDLGAVWNWLNRLAQRLEESAAADYEERRDFFAGCSLAGQRAHHVHGEEPADALAVGAAQDAVALLAALDRAEKAGE